MKLLNHKLFRNQRGYTLTELMIVVAIIGVLAAMAVPSYNKFIAHSNLNGAAREIASDLRGARVAAIKEGVQYALYYGTWSASSTTTTQFQVLRALADQTPSYPTFVSGAAVPISQPFTVTNIYVLSNLGYNGIMVQVPQTIPIFQKTGIVSSGLSVNFASSSVTTASFSTTAPSNIILTNSYGETKTISISTSGKVKIS